MTQQTSLIFPDRSKGYNCPCCNQFVKEYCRTFNSNMAIALLFLYRNAYRGYIHLENEMIEQGHKRCGDASYLRHYGLIEPLTGKREDGSKRNGYYKITGRGMLFCELKTTVQENFLIFNNSLEGFKGKEITIIDALGTKFDYQNLMTGK